MRARLSAQIRLERFQYDRSKGALSLTITTLRWAIVISVVMWVVMGLISLRFDLSANFSDTLYSQLIVAGIILAAIANMYVSNMGGFGGRRWYRASIWMPAISGIGTCVGLLLLLWYIWTDFTAGPNELLKATYSFLGVGLCGTFAGFVTLASVARVFRALQWTTYALTAVVAVETIDALWSVERLSLETAGREFTIVGIVAALTLAGYAVIALIAKDARSVKARITNLYTYLGFGLVGYGAALVFLWEALDAGPVRFVYGAAVVMTILAVAIALLHHYGRNTLSYRPPENDDRADPTAP